MRRSTALTPHSTVFRCRVPSHTALRRAQRTRVARTAVCVSCAHVSMYNPNFQRNSSDRKCEFFFMLHRQRKAVCCAGRCLSIPNPIVCPGPARPVRSHMRLSARPLDSLTRHAARQTRLRTPGPRAAPRRTRARAAVAAPRRCSSRTPRSAPPQSRARRR